MKKKIYLLVVLLVACGMAFYLSACGGGGGDGDGSGGSLDPAGNASDATFMLDLAGTEEALHYFTQMGMGCTYEGSPQASLALLSAAGLSREIASQIAERDAAVRSAGSSGRALLDETIEIDEMGDCSPNPGQLTGTITDDGAGSLTAFFNFEDFCIDNGGWQTVIHGSASFSGTYDEAAQELSLSGGTGTGGVAITVDGETSTMTVQGLSFSLSEKSGCDSSVNINVDSFSWAMPVDGGTETIYMSGVTISADAYDMGNGYCGASLSLGATMDTSDGILVIDTPSPMTTDDLGYITDGEIKLWGANNTSVLIIYVDDEYSENQFKVSADTNGDSVMEEMGTMDCSGMGGYLPIF